MGLPGIRDLLQKRTEYQANSEKIANDIQELKLNKSFLEGQLANKIEAKELRDVKRTLVLALIGVFIGVVFGITGIVIALIK